MKIIGSIMIFDKKHVDNDSYETDAFINGNERSDEW